MPPSDEDTDAQSPQPAEENPDASVAASSGSFAEYMAEIEARMAVQAVERVQADLALLTAHLPPEAERLNAGLVRLLAPFSVGTELTDDSRPISKHMAPLEVQVAEAAQRISEAKAKANARFAESSQRFWEALAKAEAKLAPETERLKRLLAVDPAQIAAAEEVKRLWKLGYTPHDLMAVGSSATFRKDQERLDAAESLLGQLPYKLHSKRRQLIVKRLGHEAVAPERIHELALAGIFVAVHAIAQRTLHDPDNLKLIAAALSELITRDLLGPHYWRSPKENRLSGDAADSAVLELPSRGWKVVGRYNGRPFIAPTAEAETSLADVRGTLQQPGFTEQERSVLETLQSAGGNVKKAAEALGVKRSTIYVHLHKIRKKIAALI